MGRSTGGSKEWIEGSPLSMERHSTRTSPLRIILEVAEDTGHEIRDGLGGPWEGYLGKGQDRDYGSFC